MALTVTIAPGFTSNAVTEGEDENLVITVTNTGASAVTLLSLTAASAQGSIFVGQPVWYTPNAAPGAGNPVLGAGASLSMFSSVVARAPYFYGSVPMAGAVPGASGSQWPGGSSPASLAAPTANPNYTVTYTAVASDGSVGVGSFTFASTTALQPAYSPEGGEMDLRRGANAGTYLCFF